MEGRLDPDSRTRTHLANERTFLAWFRTGLTLVAVGIAAAQFLSQDVGTGLPLVRLLATVVIATGVFLVAVGVYRYLDGREKIDTAAFQPAGRSVLVAAAAAAATGVLAIGFVWLFPGN